MTGSAFPVKESGSGPSPASDEGSARAERLLDAAAELLVRWGFQRVTIEDVASQAGVGKGTVYLHFRTKEALFLTVLLRVHRQVTVAAVERMCADPLEVLPSRMVRAGYLDIRSDDVTRTLYLGDPETLGRLTTEAAATLGEVSARRAVVVHEYVALLREAGALRTDLSVEEQVHVFDAIGTGFFTHDAGSTVDDPLRRADLLAHTVAAALEHPEPDPEALAAVAPRIVAGFGTVITLIEDEWRRRVR